MQAVYHCRRSVRAILNRSTADAIYRNYGSRAVERAVKQHAANEFISSMEKNSNFIVSVSMYIVVYTPIYKYQYHIKICLGCANNMCQ